MVELYCGQEEVTLFGIFLSRRWRHDKSSQIQGPSFTCHAVQGLFGVIKDDDTEMVLQLWAALQVTPCLQMELTSVSSFL